jgi:hypothetical protein
MTIARSCQIAGYALPSHGQSLCATDFCVAGILSLAMIIGLISEA